MLLLLILADDFTGALDTGVQFAACGIPTRVVVGEQVDLAASDAAVLVVDTETRHLPAAEAYAVIAKLTRDAMSAGVFSIYKKTDSALRGNIGAELSALLKTSGERQLPFLPAFPQIDRVTRDGVHYISGVPVTESPFGIDPFEPVRHARVTELIGEQTDVPAHSFPTLCSTAFYLGVDAVKGLLDMIPQFAIDGFGIAANILPAMGFAMLGRLVLTKQVMPYFFLGFLITSYAGIPVLGVAILAIIIAIEKFDLLKMGGAAEPALAAEGDDDDDF